MGYTGFVKNVERGGEMKDKQKDFLKSILPIVFFMLFWLWVFSAAFWFEVFTLFEMAVLQFLVSILSFIALGIIIFIYTIPKEVKE